MPTSPSFSTWPHAWAQPSFRRRLLIVLALLAGVALALPRFFAWVEARPGFLPPDPLLDILPAHDASGATFAVIYGGILLGLTTLLPRPQSLLRALLAFLLLHLLRLLSLALVPWEPPAALMLLHDPVVDTFFYAAPTPITKDLFFSAHTATLLLLAVAVGPGWRRVVLAIAAAAVAGLLLVQHAHYTWDVLAAVPATLLAWWAAGRLLLATRR
ncbi:hypothetical protein F0P96_09260 [Hymenobacter busanensis]|uniref:Uncharacterized protein n=1 Tax=Hymenobacter busanensis TaxID=2607656 RepID=A0A7L4ZYN6_9BACT|nr:phosphatase PAP2-related protein [Hymenobacter busanensis]KAA9333158.1 hypothetical protein F0P96_09260 [Hymenobacter busanensis]QHJ08167.1 hypothetical protein GUY19_13065 [Hymenobacter busanensis]